MSALHINKVVVSGSILWIITNLTSFNPVPAQLAPLYPRVPGPPVPVYGDVLMLVTVAVAQPGHLEYYTL